MSPLPVDERSREQRKRTFQAADEYVQRYVEANDTAIDDVLKATLLDALHGEFEGTSFSRGWLGASLKRCQRELSLHTCHREPDVWSEIFPRYPILSDGFARSFTPSQEDEIRATLSKYGLVVVRVLDDATCQRSIDAIFEEINALPVDGRTTPICPTKPWTWETWNWPLQSKYLLSAPAFHPQAFANRTNETIYKVFSSIWQEEHLMVNVDRWGVARGTKGLAFPCGGGGFAEVDRPDWALRLSYHWDYNPWLFVDEMAAGKNPGYQALVAFVDQDMETGCHLTLPGGMPFLAQWCQENAVPKRLGKKRRSHRPAHDDPIRDWMQPIPIRRGDMLIWSWGQLHSVTANATDSMRLHQYIGMFPAADVDPFYAIHENFSPRKILPRYSEQFDVASLSLSPMGERLLGLKEW